MRIKLYSLFLVLFSLFAFNSNATHLLGGDLQVTATPSANDPYKYNVRLVLYRDCDGIPLCSGSCSSPSCTQPIDARSLNGCAYGTYALDFKSVSTARADLHPSATPICDNMGCTSAGTLRPGIEKYVFEGTIVIDPSYITSGCNDTIVFSWSSCCRNSVISTGSAGEGFYIFAKLNKNIPNSTPLFSNDPYFIAFQGKPYIYNMGAWDPDGDSLSFAFVPALQAANTPVDYITPYSYQTPMPWVGAATGTFPSGIRCDAKTGSIMFTGKSAGSGIFVGVMAVGVTEWRKINGVTTKVGESMRDIQGWLLMSPANSFPTFATDTLNHFAIYDRKVCEGSTICFDITANDSDATDTTTLLFDTMLVHLGATLTPKYTTRPREDVYTFCWTPGSGTARDVPYSLFVTARDNRSPYVGKINTVFYIKVSGIQGNVSIQKSVNCDSARLTHNTLYQPIGYREWRVSLTPGSYDTSNLYKTSLQSTAVKFDKPGKYPVRLYLSADSNCSTKIIYDTLTIESAVSLKINNDTTFCHSGQPLTLRVQHPKPFSSYTMYTWHRMPNDFSVTEPHIHDSIFNIIASSNEKYFLTVAQPLISDPTKLCVYSDTVKIALAKPYADFAINDSNQCLTNNRFTFTNQSYDSNGLTMNYQWKFSDGSTSSSDTTVIKSYTSADTYTIQLKTLSGPGCIDSVTKSVVVSPMPHAAYSVNDSIQCLKGNLFSFHDESYLIIADFFSYSWNFGNGDVSTVRNPLISFATTGTFPVSLTTISSQGCKDSVTQNVFVYANSTVGFNMSGSSLCLNNNLLSLTNTSTIPNGSMTYSWEFGDGDTSSLASPKHHYSTVGFFPITLKTHSDKGCSDSLIKTAYVYPSPIASFSINDSAQCQNESFNFTNTSSGNGNGFTPVWNTGDNQSYSQNDLTHIYDAGGNYSVELIVANDFSCYDTLVKFVTVYDRPAKPVITGDSVVLKHTSSTYTVPYHTGSSWQWYIAGDSAHVLSNDTAIVMWGGKDTGVVVVAETNTNGCNSDTSYIVVRIIESTGLNDLTVLNTIQWYPVPAKDVLYFSNSDAKIKTIRLYNLEGKELATFSQEDILKRELPLKSVATGIYLLKVETAESTLTKKISIIK